MTYTLVISSLCLFILSDCCSWTLLKLFLKGSLFVPSCSLYLLLAVKIFAVVRRPNYMYTPWTCSTFPLSIYITGLFHTQTDRSQEVQHTLIEGRSPVLLCYRLKWFGCFIDAFIFLMTIYRVRTIILGWWGNRCWKLPSWVKWQDFLKRIGRFYTLAQSTIFIGFLHSSKLIGSFFKTILNSLEDVAVFIPTIVSFHAGLETDTFYGRYTCVCLYTH